MLPLALAGIGSLVLLLSAFCGLGLGLYRVLRIRPMAVDAIYAVSAGWGALVVASVIANYLYVPLHLSLGIGLAGGIGMLALAGANREHRQVLRAIGIAFLAVAPVALAAASFPAVQYDEFSHWLPNARYLYDQGWLPTFHTPNIQSGKQGYPIGVPYVTFAVSAIQGVWDDAGPKAFPVALAALFAIVLAAVCTKSDAPRASVIAVATLFATLANPFFDPRLSITSYADVPTAFMLAASVYALTRAFEDEIETASWIARASMAAFALIQIRETNIVFLIVMALSLPLFEVLTAPRDDLVARIRRSLLLAAAFLAAPLAGYLVWRLHLAAHSIGAGMPSRAFAEWDWSAPGVVIASLAGERLVKNPLAGAAAIALHAALIVAAIVYWGRISPGVRRLLATSLLLLAAQAGLLTFAYMAVFSREEVVRAASAWRYAAQLGPLVLLAVATLVPWQRLRPAFLAPATALRSSRVTPIVLLAVFAVQLPFTSRWRIDCLYPHVRPGYETLVTLLSRVPPKAPVTVVNAADTLLFVDVVKYARAVATRDWLAPFAQVVSSAEEAPKTGYVIDLREADPARFFSGARVLHASLHPEGMKSAPIAHAEHATTCSALGR